ncbi:MAG: gamma-glutamyl-gamma-aminobutyrate hydrolase family protein [Oscillospiraceae bacterium]|nr:gamma-glutamyl-gamma-aminobutyrate hydrolase family protein [Oscillospiraceae bacterium]
MKPLIGITTNYSLDDQPGIYSGLGEKFQQWNLLANDYVRSVELAGGIPVILPLCRESSVALALLERVDGVIFSGGNDLNPLCYGEANGGKVGAIQPTRDRQELALLRAALETEIPVLGICRGLQLFNVALGGTLYQDMPSQGLPAHTISAVPMQETSHMVRLQGAIAQIMGTDRTDVNSFHHQCLKKVAEPWLPLAWDENCEQVVEAIVHKTRKAFTLAVQWHPETLADRYPRHLAIFQALVAAAERYGAGA